MKHLNSILLLYHRPILRKDASTVREHINSFKQYSSFSVIPLNTELGFPSGLCDLRFSVIVLHYSLFGGGAYFLNERFLEYLERSRSSYKIAFFQDEYRYCQMRFDFLNQYQIDCIYTLLEPQAFDLTYRKYTRVKKLVSTLPGYASEESVKSAEKFSIPSHKRKIDVGYRGRRLPYYMGKGGQEKYAIALEFQQRAANLGLVLDIEAEERERLYGEKWYLFNANCRACLGVESGVSVFDLEDKVRMECEKVLAENPTASFEEISARILEKYEDNIYYRTISPRHFEAAAFRECQILFEGRYSGAMTPMVHYIPLKKDFSNFDEVIRMFKDEALRQQLIENSYRDLIATGDFGYKRFIGGFDQELLKEGFTPRPSGTQANQAQRILNQDLWLRSLNIHLMNFIFHAKFPGRKAFVEIARPLLKPLIAAYRKRTQGIWYEDPK